MKIKFLSQHQPTTAQVELFKNNGFEIEAVINHSFDCDSLDQDIKNLDLKTGDTIAGVFPLDVIEGMQNNGITTVSTLTKVRGLRVDLATQDQLKLIIFKGVIK